MASRRTRLFGCLLWSLLYSLVLGYEVPVLDTDYSRQICSGMWANQETYIQVSFTPDSRGQLAMVIYEWTDSKYLGKITSYSDEDLPKTYVCTSDAIRGGFCGPSDMGKFIFDLPKGTSIESTSFWTASVALNASTTSLRNSSTTTTSRNPFWNNRAGNPTPPPSEYESPWRRRDVAAHKRADDALNPSPSGTLYYSSPIKYNVRKTGYYCIAIVPVTVISTRQSSTDDTIHPRYHGTAFFRNTFKGMLPATDYPKVNFYSAMVLTYMALGVAWAWLCWKHRTELLPIQYYLSSLFGLLIIEMVANWAYYRYLNAHGKGTTSTVFLFVVAILDAGRNALSFFLLLIVSLGLSVVRESLDRTMIRCQALAGAHFVFGVLYSIGIVELQLESTSALLLLLFVIPLAFTLSGFLMWILYALNGTIAQLRARKQRYKLKMFERLYRILLGAVIIIAIFFVLSSFAFTGRLAEDYAARSWQYRWWLLDGYLALLYLAGFTAISFLWRPSQHNRRYMSDEIAQDEEDAEDYDLEALESRTRARQEDDDDDEATLVGLRGGSVAPSVAEDHVVFEIGDEDEDDDPSSSPKTPKARKRERVSGEHQRLSGEGNVDRRGLIGSSD